jgi:hypothetical protein
MAAQLEIRNNYEGKPSRWQLTLEGPPDAHHLDFGATGRNGPFRPATVEVSRIPNHKDIPHVWVEVYSKRQGDTAPIALYLPVEDATILAQAILAAAGSGEAEQLNRLYIAAEQTNQEGVLDALVESAGLTWQCEHETANRPYGCGWRNPASVETCEECGVPRPREEND